MKVRKITAFIVAILSVLSIATYIPQANTVSAAANVEFVYSFNSYSVSYVTGKFTTETATGYKYKATDASEWSELITAAHVFKGDVSKTYEIKVFNGETEVTLSDNTFGLIEKTDASSLKYTFATKTAAKYQEEIDALITKDTIKLGSTFTYPELKGILVSDHFDYDALKADSKLTLYYAKPSATTFTSTTSKSFTLSENGRYSYYVLAKDATGTAMECDTEKLVRKVANGIEGWYDTKDTDDVSDDLLIVPIFSFEISISKKPEITIDEIVENGFVGLEYQDAKDLINIVGENEGVRYELWYSANDLSAGVNNWALEGVDKLRATNSEAVLLEGEELEAVGFDENTLKFTPNKTGSYYVVVTAADGFGSDTAVTYAINVAGEFTTVKYNTQFWKYNWVSMMFLGISLLCLIAIILLIFVKPKEKVEEEVTTVEKK